MGEFSDKWARTPDCVMVYMNSNKGFEFLAPFPWKRLWDNIEYEYNVDIVVFRKMVFFCIPKIFPENFCTPQPFCRTPFLHWKNSHPLLTPIKFHSPYFAKKRLSDSKKTNQIKGKIILGFSLPVTTIELYERTMDDRLFLEYLYHIFSKKMELDLEGLK